MLIIIRLSLCLLLTSNINALETYDTSGMIQLESEPILLPPRGLRKPIIMTSPDDSDNDENNSNEYVIEGIQHTPIEIGPRQTSVHTPSKTLNQRNTVFSTNWSGYAAAKNLFTTVPNTVSAVYGTWIVPTVIKNGGVGYCSVWVGIDGFNTNTVEQIGVELDWTGSSQSNYAWFEMYPGPTYLIPDFPVRRGDIISAQVVYIGNSIFQLSIFNHTRNIAHTVPTAYTKSTQAKRASAEWIAEAPYYYGILPLDDFQQVFFSQCSATINGKTGVINNSSWQSTSIVMESSTNIKAIPSSLSSGGSAFSVKWYHQ